MPVAAKMDRDATIRRLKQEPELWDVIVIGGGATGLGTALESESRGYRTLLLEQHDFAKATSSRSTKLVHDGVRYLQQGNVSLVMEALRERGRRSSPRGKAGVQGHHSVHALGSRFRGNDELFRGSQVS